ncbi:MAG: hypothetical protein OHK0022_35440 [Roseiflexaceae bacterium]
MVERETRSIPQTGGMVPERAGEQLPNITTPERWVSLAVGGALTLAAIRQRPPVGLALALGGGYLIYRGATGHCPLYNALGIQAEIGGGVHVEKAIIINRPAAEIYSFWRNFEQLPQFMKHLERVETLDERRSRWTAKAPLVKQVSWEAEIIEDLPNEMIAWRSLPGADIQNSGQVRFTSLPHDRGTEVHVTLRYEPPAGAAGALVAKLFAEEPSQQIAGDLRRLRALLETGEIPTVYGQTSGRLDEVERQRQDLHDVARVNREQGTTIQPGAATGDTLNERSIGS